MCAYYQGTVVLDGIEYFVADFDSEFQQLERILIFRHKTSILKPAIWLRQKKSVATLFSRNSERRYTDEQQEFTECAKTVTKRN